MTELVWNNLGRKNVLLEVITRLTREPDFKTIDKIVSSHNTETSQMETLLLCLWEPMYASSCVPADPEEQDLPQNHWLDDQHFLQYLLCESKYYLGESDQQDLSTVLPGNPRVWVFWFSLGNVGLNVENSQCIRIFYFTDVGQPQVMGVKLATWSGKG